MSITIHAVAKKAKVSIGTASRVLNGGTKGVRRDAKERAERIIRIASELGYQRNELASTIRTGVNRTVALIGDFVEASTFSMNNVIEGILTSATEHDYGVKVYSSAQISRSLDEILNYKMKNVIVVSLDKKCRKQVSDFCKKHDLKLVYIFEQSCGYFPVVASNDRKGMCNAVLKLAELGHKRIALICAEHIFHYMDERHAGYLEGHEKAGLPVNDTLIDCHLYEKDTVISIKKMLNLPINKRPTAFISIADALAAQVINQTFRNGLEVPRDISVIGFGDSDLCTALTVPLTSIAQSFKTIGTTALKLVLGQNCGTKANSKNEYLLDTQIVYRESITICKNNK